MGCIRFPYDFLIHFEVLNTTNNTVHGNVVTLRQEMKRQESYQIVWETVIALKSEVWCRLLCFGLSGQPPGTLGCADLELIPRCLANVHLWPWIHQPEGGKSSSPHWTRPAQVNTTTRVKWNKPTTLALIITDNRSLDWCSNISH